MSTTTHRFHRVPYRIKTSEGQGQGVTKIMPTIQRFHRDPYSIKIFEENEPIIRRPGPAMQANAPPPSTARAPKKALSLHPKGSFRTSPIDNFFRSVFSASICSGLLMQSSILSQRLLTLFEKKISGNISVFKCRTDTFSYSSLLLRRNWTFLVLSVKIEDSF